MKVLLIPDKFKGSLTANEVIEAITKGVLHVFPKAIIHSIRASDGGDGFLAAVKANLKCDVISVDTVDPLGRNMVADYLFDAQDQSAYIELAKASGLVLLKDKEKNVLQTSTYGTGLQIKDAISKGSTSIYIGLGGSATNDAGLGIAAALGFYFLDADGNQLAPSGKNLSKIVSIHKKSNAPSLRKISFFAVNDVDNPLYGPAGAAFTYAAQKGASLEDIEVLDAGMQDFANLVQQQTKKIVAEIPGTGAAGGAAYGLKVFCDAKFISGTHFILELAKVKKLLAENTYDYIITGEGKFDSQTLNGKLIMGVTDLAERFSVPILAVCGQIDIDAQVSRNIANVQILEVQEKTKTLSYNMKNAGILVENAVSSFFNK